MPISRAHDSRDLTNEIIGHPGMEEVAHGIYKNPATGGPLERFCEFLGNQAEIETLFERMAGNSPESFGKSFRVAVFTARTYLGTSANGVPGGVGPFNF